MQKTLPAASSPTTEEMFVASSSVRCDRCFAEAYSTARKDSIGELYFCVHHRNQSYNALLNDGWTVIDDTEAIERLK